MSLLLNKECRLLFAKRLNLTYCVSFQEPINEALQQLQARNVQLEAELNLIKFHNETLSHKITRLEQTSEKNVSQIK